MSEMGLKASERSFPAAFADMAWPAIVLRGVVGIAFGLLAILSPVATALSLVVVLSVYLMADGILAIVSAFRAARRRAPWGLIALEGVAGVAASIAMFVFPGLSMAVFASILGVWSLLSAGVKLAVAVGRDPVVGRGWVVASALISLLFGLAMLTAPLFGAVVLTWWLGVYAIFIGVALLVFGLQVRSASKGAAAPVR